jgi:hypothetical protein
MLNVNKFTKYTVNGKEYSSLAEMPEEFRSLFADQNRNGIPDTVESIGSGVFGKTFQGKLEMLNDNGRMTYVVNGKAFENVADLPPEIKALIEDKDGNGISDLYDNLARKLGAVGDAATGLSVMRGPAGKGDGIGGIEDIPRKLVESMMSHPRGASSKEVLAQGPSSVRSFEGDYGKYDYGKGDSSPAWWVVLAFIGGVLLTIAVVILCLKYGRG